MQWNLRLAAAQRGIWRSSDLRRLLAEAGLEISAGKMSHLWSGRPISAKAVERAIAAWREVATVREVEAFLFVHGISAGLAGRLQQERLPVAG